MLKINVKGDFNKTEKFLSRMKNKAYMNILERYAKKGVDALSSATPVDSGRTASSWSYEIKTSSNGMTIYWTNDNINKNVNIAIILQYGHGTRNGGYVQGRDYINPAIRPIFDQMSNDLWREVTKS